MNTKFFFGLALIATASLFVFKLTQSPKTTGTLTSEPITTSLTLKGSDTEVQMVSSLAEAFAQNHPEVPISVTGGGSSVGIASLINGEIEMANSSRPLTEEERQQAQERGLEIVEFIVARDGLSIVVHPDNPIDELSMEDLGKIYRGEITHWSDLGGPNQEITLYGRQSTSGTYGFFREVVLQNDYAASMRNMEGTQAIVDAVINDVTGIGYAGIGYVKSDNGQPRTDLKVLPIIPIAGDTAISPFNAQAVENGLYPIFRPIYQYLSRLPSRDSLIFQFLEFEESGEGQAIVENSGFYQITPADREANQRALEPAQ